MSFIIAGFLDSASYEADDFAWDGDEIYPTQQEAEEAARNWIAEHPEGACAELIELNEDNDEGLVRRVVFKDGYEDILYPGNSNPW